MEPLISYLVSVVFVALYMYWSCPYQKNGRVVLISIFVGMFWPFFFGYVLFEWLCSTLKG